MGKCFGCVRQRNDIFNCKPCPGSVPVSSVPGACSGCFYGFIYGDNRNHSGTLSGFPSVAVAVHLSRFRPCSCARFRLCSPSLCLCPCSRFRPSVPLPFSSYMCTSVRTCPFLSVSVLFCLSVPFSSCPGSCVSVRGSCLCLSVVYGTGLLCLCPGMIQFRRTVYTVSGCFFLCPVWLYCPGSLCAVSMGA